MNRIPTEVYQSIGKTLDGRSLVASLQVSRLWYNALLPLIWTTIFAEDWLNPNFPLKYWGSNNTTDRSLQFVDIDADYIRHIRFFTWHDNKTLSARKRYSSLPRQITLFQLREISRLTSNLTRFSLAMTEITTNDTHLWSTLWILARLRSLSELELELHQVKCIKAIEEFFPLFAKLTVLKIRGHWYSGANTLFSNSDEVIPWRLKELDIDRIDKSFLPYCPDLEHLTLAFNTSSEYEYADRSEFKATILEQLQGLSKLHTIVIRDLPFDDELGVRHRLSKCEGDDNRWSYITLTEDEQGFRPVFVTLQELFSLS